MADQAVDYMTTRLAELKKELAQLDRRTGQIKAEMEWLITSLSAFRKFSGQPVPELEGVSTSLAKLSQDHRSGAGTRRRGIQQPDLVPLVRSILLKRGRPMESDEILAAGRTLGRRMGGTRENRDLTAKLKERANTSNTLVALGSGLSMSHVQQ